ncbi:MAG: hypothetical protein K9J37_18930 [Saprospiraceae bacterium]|nr:hypothetical protein [Saprospiraceae bacterium]MCF8251998.1 hypothetical protein [Saprospiraceae bacterium]MCF8281667.1 hypothetical protein [Bacteroidales bacterium]MCF8313655.1 hypothetical protein [Saprospiraceae bacterium]MCF8442362.1 hypothetical protein [Saprospiraceae bacterium]
MKKQTGIWLDYKEANFIELLDGELKQFRKIDSDVDTSKARGGMQNRGKAGGIMAGVSEKTFENRRRNEEKSYFSKIIENVRDADEVVIFGPGEAKDLLVSAIKTDPNHFNSDLKAVLTADSMTENQKVAYVKSFFEAN